jgi:hypothetical protein
VGQLVTLCAAPNEYIAIAFERALRAAGVPCVQLTCEVPFHFGINYGAGCYASILVDSADESRARAVVEDVAGCICGEEHDCQWVFPTTIHLRSYSWIVPLVLCCWGLSVGVSYGPATVGRELPLVSYNNAWIIVYWSLVVCLNLGVFAALLTANWPLAKRTVLHLAAALLTAAVLPLWICLELLFALARWILRLPRLLGGPPREGANA